MSLDISLSMSLPVGWADALNQGLAVLGLGSVVGAAYYLKNKRKK